MDGVSRRTFQALLAQGLVRRVTRGVYAAAQAPNTIEFRAHRCCLVVSPSAVVTDQDRGVAARCRPASQVRQEHRARHLDVPEARHSSPPRWRDSGERQLHKTDVVVHGVSATTKLRTACDLGRLLSGASTPWPPSTSSSLWGWVTTSCLVEVNRFKGYRGVIQLRSPRTDRRSQGRVGGRVSAPAALVRRAACRNPNCSGGCSTASESGVFRLDLALPEALFACEYDGVEFHSSDEDRAADLDRRAWLEQPAQLAHRGLRQAGRLRAAAPIPPRGCDRVWPRPGPSWPCRRRTRP